LKLECEVPENTHTLPTEGFFVLHPSPGKKNSSIASYFSYKILACKTLLPLGISNDLLWGGYGFFLDLHNLESKSFLRREENRGTGGKPSEQGCEQKHCLNSHTLQCTSHMVFYI